MKIDKQTKIKNTLKLNGIYECVVKKHRTQKYWKQEHHKY